MNIERVYDDSVRIMKQITNKEFEEYRQYLHDKRNGKRLTPDGLRFICEANGHDPEKIGKHLLEVLPKVLQKN